MFVDQVKIEVRAGTGGNGASTFRREKYVPRGGPDGGDGGRGGSLYLVADPALTTLLDFRFKSHFKAASGQHGQKSNKQGRNAPDLLLRVPVGVIARDLGTGEILGEVTTPGERLLVAAGGRGGRGNARFTSSINRAPRFAENGEPGEEREVELELKLLADVGLVGLPNAGKSSLLGHVSAARPKIADYPFTTLEPVLGVVALGESRSCVFADIPGLIEGAHTGLGLGHQFLRHIERTRVLVHVLDAAAESSAKAIANLDVVMNELRLHSPQLVQLPMLVALNKVDIAPPDQVLEVSESLRARGYQCYPISAVTGDGIPGLLHGVAEILPNGSELEALLPGGIAASGGAGDGTADWIARGSKPDADGRVTLEPARPKVRSRAWAVTREPDGAFRVAGEGLERVVAMTNVDNDAALKRFERVLERAGVMDSLRSRGVAHGDRVRVRNVEFIFMEDDEQYGRRSRRRRKGASHSPGDAVDSPEADLSRPQERSPD